MKPASVHARRLQELGFVRIEGDLGEDFERYRLTPSFFILYETPDAHVVTYARDETGQCWQVFRAVNLESEKFANLADELVPHCTH